MMTPTIDFEEKLNSFIESKRSLYNFKLFEAMRYSLFPGGKRLRPRLLFMSARFLGIDENRVVPLAIAIELIHSYSLIHDDMPCLDNDEYRRGELTCHKRFGEAIALLAGDALLNLAYETLLNASVEDADLTRASAYIAEQAGAVGMIGGQAMEFSFEEFDEALITELCLKKTGALIKAALVSPTFLVFDKQKTSALISYSSALGLSFQLRDDILDEEKCEKKTFLFINGKEKTLSMIEKLNLICKNSLAKWEEGAELISFADYLMARNN